MRAEVLFLCVALSSIHHHVLAESCGSTADSATTIFLGSFYTIDLEDNFGSSVANIGDLDGDSTNDLVVGAIGDDDGGESTGAVYVLFLESNGNVKGAQKISKSYGGLNSAVSLSEIENIYFGSGVAGLGDLDNDGVVDIAVGAEGEVTNTGAVFVLFLKGDGSVKSAAQIDVEGSIGACFLAFGDLFGCALSTLDDADQDGVVDLLIGARGDTDGAGAAYVVFMNTNGSWKTATKISSAAGLLSTYNEIATGDGFGYALAGLPSVNSDEIPDMAVSAYNDAEGGKVYILMLSSEGSVIGAQMISNSYGGLSSFFTIDASPFSDKFGSALCSLEDLDSDGIPDVAVGAETDDDSGVDSGAV